MTEKIHPIDDLFNQVNDRLAIIGETPDAFLMMQLVEVVKQSQNYAELYSWLRDPKNWTEDGLCPIVASGEDTIYGDHLDARIRAAIAEGKQA